RRALARHPLRTTSSRPEFRYVAPHLFLRREHVALPCYPTCLALRLELCQVGPAEDERDHAPEKPPERHDGYQDFQLTHQVLPSPLIGSVRSAGPRGSSRAAARRSPCARRAPPARAARPRAPG